MTPNLKICSLYPPLVVEALRIAARTGNLAEIDRITDRILVPDGLARPRADMSMYHELQAQCDRVRRA